MISPETPQDILAEIAQQLKQLKRIADALEAFNKATIVHRQDASGRTDVWIRVWGDVNTNN